jgi:hypothetical protein
VGDCGELLTRGLDDEDLADSIREMFEGITARLRYVIGTEANRVYEYELSLEGPDLQLKSVTTVDYGAEVTINRPD